MKLNIRKSDIIWQSASILLVLMFNTLFIYSAYITAYNDLKETYVSNAKGIANEYCYNVENDGIPDATIVNETIFKFSLDYKKHKYIVDNRSFVYNFIEFYILSSLFIIIFYTVFLTINIIRRKSRMRIEETIANSYMESKLYRTMSTVVTHEMSLPITVSKICMRNIKKRLHEAIDDANPKCSECSIRSNYKSDFAGGIECLEMNLSSIESVVGRFDLDKDIRSGQDDTPLMRIIEAGVASVNMGIEKIDYRILDKNVLSNYGLTNNISQGAMLNIIINHVTNSRDAKASIIEFRGKVKDSILELLVIDNGRGVRDLDGKVVNNLDIFNNGYSTKDKYGNPLKLTVTDKILYKLGISTGKTKSSERGIGLSINTTILNEGGGNITLVSTSKSHTIFKLLIPVKKIK